MLTENFKRELKEQWRRELEEDGVVATYDVIEELDREAAQCKLALVAVAFPDGGALTTETSAENNATEQPSEPAQNPPAAENGTESDPAKPAESKDLKPWKAFASPELQKLLDDTGLGDHPEVIRYFYRVSTARLCEVKSLRKGHSPHRAVCPASREASGASLQAHRAARK
jgi:hypothetical protein